MNKTQLRTTAKISSNAMAKLGKNESVPLATLEKICDVLHCSLEDILELNIDEEEEVQGNAPNECVLDPRSEQNN